MDIRGTQPLDGTMVSTVYHDRHLPGYPGVGHIKIVYSFPNGIQTV
jgi:hypothetical protein